ncbi:MAG: hypothetical protein ACOVP4_07630 [Bacteriovoracaceae bacterium]|jgi:hypothetical protein
MKWFICLGLALVSATCFAKVELLTTITSDVDKETSYLSIDIDDDSNEITKMILQTKNAAGVETGVREFDYDEVMTKGVVLLHKEGRDVVSLKPADKSFSFLSAGTMRVIYLYSGINNSTREVKINLVPLAEGGSFHLTTEEGVKTNRMFVKANKALGKIIGIKEIQFSYKD